MKKSIQTSKNYAHNIFPNCHHSFSKFAHILFKQHILSLAVIADKSPYCATLFYVYEPPWTLIISSHLSSTHMQAALKNKNIAGSIANDTQTIRNIRGIQFQGEIDMAKPYQQQLYDVAYPIAKMHDSTYWAITIKWAKVTDNAFLGFGKKRILNIK